MRISDWSSDVCSSDLVGRRRDRPTLRQPRLFSSEKHVERGWHRHAGRRGDEGQPPPVPTREPAVRSEEHTSELQSLMRISYAVFCLKQKTTNNLPNYLPVNSQHRRRQLLTHRR